MQLTAGNSGKPVPLGSSGNEGNQDSDGYDIQIESGITDKSNSPDKMGYSLPTDIANYAESSKGSSPGLEVDSHKAEAEYLQLLNPTIVELAKQIGRSGGTSHEVTGKFQSASRSDISGITIGNDLNCLLPSELALLGAKSTETCFISDMFRIVFNCFHPHPTLLRLPMINQVQSIYALTQAALWKENRK